MGGGPTDDDLEIASPLTLILVGRTGNGKSATGNTILGTKAFESKRSSSGVTSTSELQTTVLEDRRILNVIDTPGLFDSSVDHEFIKKEIVCCIDKARDGIHAILVVFSVCCRFSEEEKAAISSLLTLFGRKVYDYIIVVFTGGDELEQDGKTLEDFLSGCPETLKETLDLCGNRYVLFDNRTNDQVKRSDQIYKLLSAVNMVSDHNGGKPYTNDIFLEFKKCIGELSDQSTERIIETQFIRIYEMIESKLKEEISNLEKLLAEERDARMKAEENAKAAKEESDEVIRKLAEKLEKMHEEEKSEKMHEEEKSEKMHEEEKSEKMHEEKSWGCVIL